jgi:predicted dehydrogenase
MSTTKKLKLGLVGGGPGSFIGAIHLNGALMDGMFELVCGAFSSDPAKSTQKGKELRLDPSRVYGSYDEMFAKESQLPEGERMDVVAIVTPNNMHFDPTAKALQHGFHVALDKPLTLNYAEAQALYRIVSQSKQRFLLTHTYTGYPMIKQARQMVQEGMIGKVRKVYVEYPQGWLSKLTEREGNAQAAWRTDPKRSGKSGCMGDIGTHAAHLAEYITGLKITQICADLNVMVEGRMLDDDGNVLLKFENGGAGVLMASQVAAGEENALKIRVYGEKGGIEWAQHEPNTMLVKWLDQPTQIYRAGGNYADRLSSFAVHNSRTPGGHPEGYLEAFANIYRNFSLTLGAHLDGTTPTAEMLDFPGVEDGIRGMAFIDNVVLSSQSSEKWTPHTI